MVMIAPTAQPDPEWFPYPDGDGDPKITNFPAPFTGASGPVPRDCTIVITRKDGGVIGS